MDVLLSQYLPSVLIDCVRDYNMPSKDYMAYWMREVVRDINLIGTLGESDNYHPDTMLYYTKWIGRSDSYA